MSPVPSVHLQRLARLYTALPAGFWLSCYSAYRALPRTGLFRSTRVCWTHCARFGFAHAYVAVQNRCRAVCQHLRRDWLLDRRSSPDLACRRRSSPACSRCLPLVAPSSPASSNSYGVVVGLLACVLLHSTFGSHRRSVATANSLWCAPLTSMYSMRRTTPYVLPSFVHLVFLQTAA